MDQYRLYSFTPFLKIALTICMLFGAIALMTAHADDSDSQLDCGITAAPAVDRRPGILEEPSELPTGENAAIYYEILEKGREAPKSL